MKPTSLVGGVSRVPADTHKCPCHKSHDTNHSRVTKGRYHALAEDQECHDLDLDLPMMMLEPEEDVSPAGAAGNITSGLASSLLTSTSEYPADRNMAPLTKKNVEENALQNSLQVQDATRDSRGRGEADIPGAAGPARVPAAGITEEVRPKKTPKQIMEEIL